MALDAAHCVLPCADDVAFAPCRAALVHMVTLAWECYGLRDRALDIGEELDLVVRAAVALAICGVRGDCTDGRVHAVFNWHLHAVRLLPDPPAWCRCMPCVTAWFWAVVCHAFTLDMGTGVLEDSAGVLRDFCSVAELGKLWSHRQQGKLWRPDWVAWESMLEGGGELDGGGCGSESDGELA